MADNASDKAKDAVEKGADVLDDAVQTASRKTSKAISQVRDKAKDAIGGGQDVMEDAIACAKDMIRVNPITSVLAVAAVAYLVGRLKR